MTVYVWRDGLGFVDRKTGARMEVPEGELSAPAVVPDLPGYLSPLGTGLIEGRAARREDLKRGNCREVDPSEFKPAYRSERFAQKHGRPFEGQGTEAGVVEGARWRRRGSRVAAIP